MQSKNFEYLRPTWEDLADLGAFAEQYAIPDPQTITRRFMRAFLESEDFKSQIRRTITGSAQPNFGPSHLDAVEIPLPDFAMQTKFEEMAETIFQMSASRKKAVGEADALFSSLFQRAFSGELTSTGGK